jgi:hypothetical protein
MIFVARIGKKLWLSLKYKKYLQPETKKNLKKEQAPACANAAGFVLQLLIKPKEQE